MSTDQIAEESPVPRRTDQGPAVDAAGHSGLSELEEQARALIRKRPVVAVLASVGIGYLVARLVGRAMR